ncbi:hypothetical protein L207DRAFT_583559 [Hyaloscypha variabilis F]|uniref:BTB domain-containing protein n=1 Tax=Hyaloscypha variabilis (strain UAMH 11265 / GT02V1 / F) TaxID=1149755 RepID=A0A2J6RMF4_HYAVF|nr:hypothetical protein L207DRAFT_583559 [Hyaloscypha variabilis F]
MASEANPPFPMASEASNYPNVYSTPIKVPRPGPTFFNSQELVTFHVGSGTEKQTFLAHKESQSYTLEDVEAGVFRLMLQWLYGQKIEYYLTQAEANSLRTPQHTEEQRKLVYGKIEERQRLLVRLWVLAEMLMLPRLQNLVVDELDSIQRDWKNSFPWRCLNYVYANTAEYSPLRRLILAH